MDVSARNEYLTTEVLTATPQKLHLMVIEAAIRSAERAREGWQQADLDASCQALVHAQECVGQLLAGLDREAGGEVADKLAALYMFVFRRLVDANVHRDKKKLDEALRILKMERETWRQACAAAPPASRTATVAAPGLADDLPAGGFSLQV